MRSLCAALLILLTALVWSEVVSARSRDDGIFLPRYTRQANGIRLPLSAERLILKKTEARYITYVSELIFFPRYDRHYLGVNVSLVPGRPRNNSAGPSWEGVWHFSFVLEKYYLDPVWDKAIIYEPDVDLSELLMVPSKDFFAALGEPID